MAFPVRRSHSTAHRSTICATGFHEGRVRRHLSVRVPSCTRQVVPSPRRRPSRRDTGRIARWACRGMCNCSMIARPTTWTGHRPSVREQTLPCGYPRYRRPTAVPALGLLGRTVPVVPPGRRGRRTRSSFSRRGTCGGGLRRARPRIPLSVLAESCTPQGQRQDPSGWVRHRVRPPGSPGSEGCSMPFHPRSSGQDHRPGYARTDRPGRSPGRRP